MNVSPHIPKTDTELPRAADSLSKTSLPCVLDHELLQLIDRGSYGEVWLARSVIGTYRAVKIVYRKTFESERPYQREFSGIQKFEPISRSHEGLEIGRAHV